jgi:transcriptional regulator with XRE-family HTH domain
MPIKKTPSPSNSKTGLTMEQLLAAIRDERLRQQLTFEAAGEPIGMARTNWQRIESGNRRASEKVLQQMANRLGLSLTFTTTVVIDRSAKT